MSTQSAEGTDRRSGGGALLAGGIAAILASACCLGPLVLMGVGVSGAWIGNLALLEPYRPLFIAVAVIALAMAWRRIWRPAIAGTPADACAIPRVKAAPKILFAFVVLLVLAALVFPYVV